MKSMYVKFAVCIIASFFAWIVNASGSYVNDWHYFASLSLVVRSLFLQFNQFPLHNPWVGGGLDLLANPQNRIFSPLVLLDLGLPPTFANLAGLMIWAGLGIIGFIYLCDHLKIRRESAFLGGWLFINSNWFGLHFTEGHIPFGAMQALPLAMYLMTRFGSILHLVGLVALLAIMLLDGAIYCVIYCGFVGLTMLLAGMIDLKSQLVQLRSRIGACVTALVGALLLAMPKWLPVLSSISDRQPVIDYFTMPADLLIKALFYPLNDISMKIINAQGDEHWRMHEFACYLSITAIVFVCYTAAQHSQIRRNLTAWSVAALFWFWVGSGWLESVNPWRFFQMLPIVNNAHVQSRVFLIGYLFLCLCVSKTAHSWAPTSKLLRLVTLFLMVEALFVRNYPMIVRPQQNVQPIGYELITRSNIKETHQIMAWLPNFYLEPSEIAASKTYEPSIIPKAIRGIGHPEYRGEAFPATPGNGRVEVISYKPGHITAIYELKQIEEITFNTNSLFGWRSKDPDITPTGRGTELLKVRPSKLNGRIELYYRPWYLEIIFGGFIGGLSILAFLLWFELKRKQP